MIITNINSIDPKLWGKSGWIFLNSIALTYNPENKNNYKLFFEQLSKILPCVTCGKNLLQNMDSLDSALSSKYTLLTWLLNIRNNIRKEFGQNPLTMNDGINEIYFNNYNKIFLILSYSIIVIILLVLFSRCK